MDRLIHYINNYYKERLKSTELSEDEKEELEFLESICKTMDINGKDSILKINVKDLVIAILCGSESELTYKEIRDKVSLLNVEKIPDYDYCFIFNDYVKEFNDKGLLEEFVFLPYEHLEFDEDALKLKEAGLLDLAEKAQKIIRTMCPTDKSRIMYFRLIEDFGVPLINALVVAGAVNGLKFTAQAKDFVADNGKDISNFTLASNAGYRAIVQTRYMQIAQDEIREKEINYDITLRVTKALDCLDSIRERATEIKNLPRLREKENNSIIRKRDKVINIIKSFNLNRPIDLSKGTLDSITDERIKYLVLRTVLKHNLQFHNETINRLKEEETMTRLEKIFKKSCCTHEYLMENLSKLTRYGNIENIEKIMTLLTESGIKIYNDSYPICDILLLSTPAIVSTVNKMITSSVISQEFVKRNPEIFVKDINEEIMQETTIKEAAFDRIVNNVNLLRDNKIDAFAISKSRNSATLLQDREQLENVLRLINTYSLRYSTSNNYEFFENTNLVEIIDRFIELGLSKFIRNNPKYIGQESYTYLKRMELCRELGLPLVIDNKLSPKITDQAFRVGKNIISDEDIDGYVPNAVYRFMDDSCYKAIAESKGIPKESFIIEELEKYSISDLEYNINGIIISKQKVLRNFAILQNNSECDELSREQKIFNAMIYGSVLDDSRLKIISEVFGTPGQRLEKK